MIASLFVMFFHLSELLLLLLLDAPLLLLVIAPPLVPPGSEPLPPAGPLAPGRHLLLLLDDRHLLLSESGLLLLHVIALEEPVDGWHIHLNGLVEEGVGAAPADLVGVIKAGGLLGGLVPWELGLGLALRGSLWGLGDHGRGLVALLVRLSGGGLSGVKAPPGQQGLLNQLRRGELHVADLLGDDGALMLRCKTGDKLGLETASRLGVEITGFLRDIHKGGDGLIMALLFAFFSDATSSTNLHWKLLASRVSNKPAWLFLNVAGGTGGLVDSPALLRTLPVAHFGQGPVALLHILLKGLLLKGDLARLLKVFLANFLLGRLELCDVSVVALLHLFMGAL